MPRPDLARDLFLEHGAETNPLGGAEHGPGRLLGPRSVEQICEIRGEPAVEFANRLDGGGEKAIFASVVSWTVSGGCPWCAPGNNPCG